MRREEIVKRKRMQAASGGRRKVEEEGEGKSGKRVAEGEIRSERGREADG